MNLKFVALIVAVLTWANPCYAHSVSGAYINQGGNFVELLQITAKDDGSLEGTLTRANLASDGSLSQSNAPLAGVVDGTSITVTLKGPLSFLTSSSLSGTVNRGAIALTLPDGVARYVMSEPSTYQAAIRRMKADGKNIKWEKHIADQNEAAAVLNKQLSEYVARISDPINAQRLHEFHATHEAALAKAKRGLHAQRAYPRNSVTASQISVSVSQIAISLETYDIGWERAVLGGRTHLQELDAAVAGSVCSRPDAPLSSCDAQPASIEAYRAVKPMVERNLTDIESTLKTDRITMDAIVKQANDYAR